MSATSDERRAIAERINVVRCRECRWYERGLGRRFGKQARYCKRIVLRCDPESDREDGLMSQKDPDGFCSWGKRSDDQ